MPVEVVMPKWGLTMEEGLIGQWLKNEGDEVTKGEPLLEVETEKMANVVESPASGILTQIVHPAGSTIAITDVIAVIGAPGESVSRYQATPQAKATESATSEETTTPEKASSARIRISPLVKKRVLKLGIDVSQVRGSGPNGRILLEDVENFARSGQKQDMEETATGDIVTITKMRRAIGKVLQHSFRDTPHFNVTMPIVMTRALEFRQQFNESRPKQEQISVNDLLVKACAMALKQHPAVNSRLEEDHILHLTEINIGIATAIDSGLVVPVLRQADQYDWQTLVAETRRLVQQARAGKVIGAGEGTFTISNLGMFGVEQFTAIINPPESAILAVGGIHNEAVEINGAAVFRPTMKVTLAADHRIIDGSQAAQFLLAIKTYLEEKI
jgi:pyruvate dehydrogenase E2 component (dihydrolipoamide acetyltransferase)